MVNRGSSLGLALYWPLTLVDKLKMARHKPKSYIIFYVLNERHKKLNLKSIEMDNQYFKINFISHEFWEIMKLKTKCYRTRGSQFLDLEYTVLYSDQL